jgi:E3 ubiquitin-protein ligase DOA10
MISPCKCTGSLKFVHDDCLKEWIYKIVNKSSQKISSGKAHICCEICKEKIFFKTSKTLKCKTKE